MVLAIDPLTPSTVYAGTEAGVVFRTADAGRTWIGTGVTNQNASTVLVPTNAHSAGREGPSTRLNLLVSNLTGSAATFTLKFLGSNQDGSSSPEKTFDVDPRTSATFSDVLGSVLGKTNDFGAIGITSNTSGPDDIFSVTSTPGFGGTFGLTIPAVPFSGMLFDPIPFFGYPSDSTPCIREGDGFPTTSSSRAPLAGVAAVTIDFFAQIMNPSRPVKMSPASRGALFGKGRALTFGGLS